MDGSLWTGIFIVVLIIAAIILLANSNGKGQRKKLLKKLAALAAQNGGHISISDVWRHRAIGIDEKNRVLYFINTFYAAEQELQADLTQAGSCIIVKAHAGAKENLSNQNKRIEMELHSRSSGTLGTIPFFDIMFDNDPEREAAEKRAEQWKEHVYRYMNQNK